MQLGGVASHGSFPLLWAWDTRPISESRDIFAQISKMSRILILSIITFILFIVVVTHYAKVTKFRRNNDVSFPMLVATSK